VGTITKETHDHKIKTKIINLIDIEAKFKMVVDLETKTTMYQFLDSFQQ
jgi:hypothetical protein